MDVSRCAPSVLYAYDLGALWVSGWMPGPRTPPGAQSCADTPTTGGFSTPRNIVAAVRMRFRQADTAAACVLVQVDRTSC